MFLGAGGIHARACPAQMGAHAKQSWQWASQAWRAGERHGHPVILVARNEPRLNEIATQLNQAHHVEVTEHLKNVAPLQRLGETTDIASVVSFLASSDDSWINGQVLRAMVGPFENAGKMITRFQSHGTRLNECSGM